MRLFVGSFIFFLYLCHQKPEDSLRVQLNFIKLWQQQKELKQV